MGFWNWKFCIYFNLWYKGSLCAISLWKWILFHKIPSWENQILESYLPLYAWILDVDIYFYFYDNTYFIPCKDPFFKTGIICWFYRRNNVISIQVSHIPFISITFFCPWEEDEKIGLRKILILPNNRKSEVSRSQS